MYAGELQQSRDAIEETHEQEPVQRSCVANFRQIRSWVEWNGW